MHAIFNTSILYAMGSMFFAGVNDFVFKKHAMSGMSQGQYLGMTGLVWTAVFSLFALVTAGDITISRNAIVWGIVAGFFSIISNYLLVSSLRYLDAGIGATIFRLNLVIVAIMAFILFDETLTMSKGIGLCLACAAVILFAGGTTGGKKRDTKIKAFVLAIAASVLRAGMGLSYKFAAIDFASLPKEDLTIQNYWFLAIQGLMWFVVSLFISIRFERSPRISIRNTGYGMLSGGLICGIVLFMARALVSGDASVVIPITQMSFLMTSLLSWPLIKERFSMCKLSALATSTAAILFLTANSSS